MTQFEEKGYEGDHLTASLVMLLIGESLEETMKELNKKISSQSSLKTRKVVKLLPFPQVKARKNYKFEGFALWQPHSTTNLTGMKTYDNLSRFDVIFSSFGIEEVESPVQTFIEVLPWIDWWLYAAGSIALSNCGDEAKCYCLFFAGSQTHMMITWITSVLWVNTIFKHRDEVLTKGKANITYGAKMELRNTPLLGSTELLPAELVSKSAKKLS